jgi:membrane associated rhomboid family serine protease
MTRSIFDDIKSFFVSGNMINKLIVVNIIVGFIYLFVNLFAGLSISGYSLAKYYLLSIDVLWDISHPWVFITYLFGAGSILHFIFNMLFLYWFGSIIGDLIGDKKILPLYVLGGLFGAISYIILGNLFFSGNFYYIMGLDSVILSIAVASAVLVPDYKLKLILIGEVSLKIIVIVYAGLEFLYAISSYNPVYLSYIGSVIFGWYYIYSMKRGSDLSKPFNKVWDKTITFFSFSKNKQKRKLSVKYKSGIFQKSNKSNDKEYKKELNRILDKIKRVGYDNLNEEEKEFLFLASKRE